MLKFTLKHFFTVTATCFGLQTIIRESILSLAKVTFVDAISKITPL
jgi:hypothetical protein